MASVVKELLLKEIKKEFEENPYAFISSFESLPVAEASDLRRNLEKVAKRSLVVKHSLAKKVFEQMNCKGAESFLSQHSLVTFADKEPQAVSKAIVAFAKENKKFVSAGVIFENQVYAQDFVKQLALLPSRQELLTQVVVRMKSPISGFVMTLNQLLRGLVQVLNEVKKKREAQPSTASS